MEANSQLRDMEANSPDVPTPHTRVWTSLKSTRSEGKGEAKRSIKPPLVKSSEGQLCLSREDTYKYIFADSLRGGKRQHFQEIWADDVVCLLLDDDN